MAKAYLGAQRGNGTEFNTIAGQLENFVKLDRKVGILPMKVTEFTAPKKKVVTDAIDSLIKDTVPSTSRFIDKIWNNTRGGLEGVDKLVSSLTQ